MNKSFTEVVVHLSTTDDDSLQVRIDENTYSIAHVKYRGNVIRASDVQNERVIRDVDCAIQYTGGLGAKPVRSLVIDED